MGAEYYILCFLVRNMSDSIFFVGMSTSAETCCKFTCLRKQLSHLMVTVMTDVLKWIWPITVVTKQTVLRNHTAPVLQNSSCIKYAVLIKMCLHFLCFYLKKNCLGELEFMFQNNFAGYVTLVFIYICVGGL